METNENALLAVIADHLEVTGKQLEHYSKIAKAVRSQQEMATQLPLVQSHPTLQELHDSTLLMQKRVQSGLGIGHDFHSFD
jgi:hypothetical protein